MMVSFIKTLIALKHIQDDLSGLTDLLQKFSVSALNHPREAKAPSIKWFSEFLSSYMKRLWMTCDFHTE